MYGPCVDPWLICTGGGGDEIAEEWEWWDSPLVDYPHSPWNAAS